MLSGEVRGEPKLDPTLLDERGRAQLVSFYEIRKLTQALNASERLPGVREKALEAGRVGAIARLDEISRFIIERYRTQRRPQVFERAREQLAEGLGSEQLEGALERFWHHFPPEPVRKDEVQLADYVDGDYEVFVDLIAVWLLNENPAVRDERLLFDDSPLREDGYDQMVAKLGSFFDDQPGIELGDGRGEEPLLTFLRRPIDHGGDSLEAQLDYIRQNWGHLLSANLLNKLLVTMDVIEEEKKARRFPGAGPGPVEPPSFAGLEEEPERFSEDLDWMAEVVVIAKNVHVWLHQLSRRYDREIHRLDQIPDAELDRMAEWGISGLWLIGLWKRSDASQRIKELSGSPHVVSSAYSIYEYRVADDLGGQEAWDALRERARSRGVRMAADMVPNHMGITSKWVLEHPEWLLTLDEPPYDSYSFTGPDLSDDERVGIYLEDHYYDHSDAAVVFKRVDYQHGNTQYIYHGNDGTSMPWNDTAQIDYLNPQAREAVIQQILDVAKKCSVIRFDAAMTLVKRHIQRLWYPEPGSGGAIPSRAGRGMSKEDFERVMPREFWTEVVDRIAEEAPDTLLLAEAFWMLEGYFVRSLGMHRVYNSAFMNMLSDEDNAGYRTVMKDTLEFDPQILRRYVNFMNNPDEETAVAQFGKGDKYFGVCTMMVTMPGLPMFGHGQIQGFVEKYGMDFNKPRIDEQPDEGLIDNHRRRIFPLLQLRRLFAGVENFLLYDLYNGNQAVDENVFAYSNRLGDRKGFVVYNNRYGETSGWIRDSAAYRDKSVGGDGKLVRKRLVHGLDIEPRDDVWITFRDHITGLEYLRHSRELADRGFYVELGAYDCHVFVEFEEVREADDGRYGRLAERLGGRGVPSLLGELRHMELEPVHDRLTEVLSVEAVSALAEGTADETLLDALRPALNELGEVMDEFGGLDDAEGFVEEVGFDLDILLELEVLTETTPVPIPPETSDPKAASPDWAMLLAWAVLRPIGGLEPDADTEIKAQSLFDEWSLDYVLSEFFDEVGMSADGITRAIETVRYGLSRQGWLTDLDAYALEADELFELLVDDPEASALLGVNRHEDVLWYHGESFDDFVHWLSRFAALYAALEEARAGEKIRVEVPEELRENIEAIVKASKKAEFQVQMLLDTVERLD